MIEKIYTFLKSDEPFHFYSWMKLAALTSYFDLFIGFTMNRINFEICNFETIDISLLIFFVIFTAFCFPLIIILIIFIHFISLFIDLVLFFIKRISFIEEIINNNSIDSKNESYMLSFEELMDYSLINNNKIIYNIAINCKQEYEKIKYNRYITVAAFILLCFDINEGAILSNIFEWKEEFKYLIYIPFTIASYVLLCKIAIYNDSCYKTKSKELYDKITNNK